MSKSIHALYDDEQLLLKAAKELVGKGVHVSDVFSPFPIHGLDPIIGIKKTRLAICAFLFGITGTTLALAGMWYFMVAAWPGINVGGKPNFHLYENLPAFIPIVFEFTVLCASHGMALTFFLRNWTLPGVKAINPDPRTTNDKFLMIIDESGFGENSEADIKGIINGSEVFELTEMEVN
ncbi:MAG: DUF3341 domain-containing protein [Bacteroidetes bacterium]|nr:DUF3341 domain-containing protein [Bacteroidota bacterium]